MTQTSLAFPTAAFSPPASPDVADAAASEADFSDLKRMVDGEGLLVKSPAAYIWHGLWLLAALGLSVAVMAWSKNVAVQLVNGAFLAFVFTHIGFIMHDAGHRQIFRSSAHNDFVGLLCANLGIGLSFSWWTDKHNRHHANPNQLDVDPDIDFPVVAFSPEQALAKPKPLSYIVRYQAFLFFPLLMLEAFNLRAGAVEHLARGRAKRPWVEGSLLVAHYVIYAGIIFTLLPVGAAIAFILANQMLAGLYTGSVFAPNHKGMALFERDTPAGFLERQVLSSRNVRPGPVTDFLYGALNYQIEHHLFPGLPRHRMAAAHGIVRQFCHDRGLSYAETGVVQSYREIVTYLHQVSAPLRRGGRALAAPVPDEGGTS
ncbi:MAG TPA: acyl-CoA desaturase [Thermoanaerobaculia bacterium]|nr:acyl-CoA desaturase [Thermoanaerobaculia bacterium]